MLDLDPSGRSLEIACASCKAQNRVPLARIADRPVCGRCRTRLAVGRPLELSDATFELVMRESPIPVLVDFWAPWCGPCRMVAPELEKVAQLREGELLVAKLDTDRNQAAAGRLGIRAIPSLVLFSAGKEVRRLTGAMSADQILARLG